MTMKEYYSRDIRISNLTSFVTSAVAFAHVAQIGNLTPPPQKYA